MMKVGGLAGEVLAGAELAADQPRRREAARRPSGRLREGNCDAGSMGASGISADTLGLPPARSPGRLAAVIVLGLLGVALPLVCWALLARTARAGWVVAALLAACGAGELGLASGWIQSGEKVTLLVALALVMPLVIVAGSVVERRHAGARRLRSGGVRGIAGMVLSVAYVGFSFVAVPLTALMILTQGLVAHVPSSAEVLPLPAGLAVAGNQDQGCASGSHTTCSRRFLIKGTTGLSEEEVAQRLREQLARAHGWRMDPTVDGWGGCRTEGWLLDRQQVCVGVYTSQHQVTMLLQGGN